LNDTPTGTITTYNSQLFGTPDNPINITFDALGISPGSGKLTLEEAEERIIDDKILEQKFANPSDKSPMVHRYIFFLYAMGFFWEMDRKDRIQKIKDCVNPQGEEGIQCKSPLERLRRIAFSDASDIINRTQEAFEHF
jgi:hypothetical protein